MFAASGPGAKARQRCGQLGERRELRLRVELLRPVVEDRLRLWDVRIGDAAVDGTDGRAGFLLVEADALGTEDRVDDEDVLTLADGAVRALWLASAAVDAFLGDHRCHVRQSLQLRLRFQSSDRHRQRNVAAAGTQPYPESVSGREQPGSTVENDSYAALWDEIQLERRDRVSRREDRVGRTSEGGGLLCDAEREGTRERSGVGQRDRFRRRRRSRRRVELRDVQLRQPRDGVERDARAAVA